MAEDVKSLSTELARDPQSLVFLRLGELLRKKGQHDAAQRVAVQGRQGHPPLADAHDLYARILADRHDYERAFDEWDMALRIAPAHTGALKGLAFLYFKVGDLAQAEAHLLTAKEATPDDPSIDQALALVRGRVLGGALRDPQGKDVTDVVAAYLAGVSQEAARTAKLLGLGQWTGLSAEGRLGHVHVAAPTAETLLLVVRDRGVPMGRLAILAQRAAQAARRWLEKS